MSWVTGIAVYVVIWWLVIFMVLPWGNRPVGEADLARGHMAGAPQRPRLPQKALVTTGIAAVLWGIFYLVVEYGGISFRGG